MPYTIVYYYKVDLDALEEEGVGIETEAIQKPSNIKTLCSDLLHTDCYVCVGRRPCSGTREGCIIGGYDPSLTSRTSTLSSAMQSRHITSQEGGCPDTCACRHTPSP